MNEILLRLDELLFPSIADVAVLSVDVNIAIVRVDVRCTAAGASCVRVVERGLPGFTVPTYGFLLMFRVRDEVSYSNCGFAGSPAGTPNADVARSSSSYLASPEGTASGPNG